MSVLSLSSAPGRLVSAPDSASRGSGRPLSRSDLAGRLVELSSWGGGARLTLAFDLILQAQIEGRATAWIAVGCSMFFPPDAARCGVDLEAMPVVRVPDARAAARAADKLVRSGAFDLIVADLEGDNRIPLPLQSRLLGLVAKHDAAVVFLTEKKPDGASIGSLVSLHAEATRNRIAENRFACQLKIIKDKRQGPGWSCCEVHRGPAGLR